MPLALPVGAALDGADFGYLTANGCWTWYGDPKAVYYEGTHQKTYVGWITNTGDIVVGSYNHQTHVIESDTLHPNFEPDDHDHPSLHVLPDGRIMAFWSYHGSQWIFYATTTNPEDITAWEPRRQMLTPCTYPNLVSLSDEDNRIYLFHRGSSQPNFVTSDDSGETWTSATQLIQGGDRPYVKYATDHTSRIHIVFEHGHRSNPHSFYYMYYEGGNLYKADGTLIKSMSQLPVYSSQAERLYNVNVEEKHATVWDIALDENGYPVIVWVKFEQILDHRYHYMRWTGTEWFDIEFTPGGGLMGSEWGFSGGLTLDHSDPNIVYVSRHINRVLELERWVTQDNGHTWTTTTITSSSSDKNTRPCVPRNSPAGSPVGLIWLHGQYVEFNDGLYFTRVNYMNPDTLTAGLRFVSPTPGIALPGMQAPLLDRGISFGGMQPRGMGHHVYDITGRRIHSGDMLADKIIFWVQPGVRERELP